MSGAGEPLPTFLAKRSLKVRVLLCVALPVAFFSAAVVLSVQSLAGGMLELSRVGSGALLLFTLGVVVLGASAVRSRLDELSYLVPDEHAAPC